MNSTILGLIIVPIAIFTAGGVFGGVRLSIRFAQYLVRSEEAQQATAKSNQQISDQLGKYMEKTDSRLGDHDQQLAVLQFALRSGNGRAGE